MKTIYLMLVLSAACNNTTKEDEAYTQFYCKKVGACLGYATDKDFMDSCVLNSNAGLVKAASLETSEEHSASVRKSMQAITDASCQAIKSFIGVK